MYITSLVSRIRVTIKKGEWNKIVPSDQAALLRLAAEVLHFDSGYSRLFFPHSVWQEARRFFPDLVKFDKTKPFPR